MTTTLRPLAEVSDRAFGVLTRELGVVDTMRFVQQFSTGSGDYTKERHALFAGKTLEDIVAEIEKKQKAQQES